tara:strand:- start:1148 stop:2023 length:876 start_codon:yes stop_codon:yes gene_type:complete
MHFSIVTPARAIDNKTQQTIDCVFKQNFKGKFEHIVIIDDQKEMLPKDLSNKNYSIKYIRSCKNPGPSSSRNEGISISKGKIICLLDSDDIWEFDYLKNLAKIFDQDKSISAVSVPGYCFGENIRSSKLITAWQQDGFISNSAISWNIIGCPSGFSFLHSLKDKMVFNENLRWCEDFYFYLNFISIKNLKIFRTNKFNYWYRISDEQVSNKPDVAMIEDSKNAFMESFKKEFSNLISVKESMNVYIQAQRSFKKAIGKNIFLYTIILSIISPSWFFATLIKLLHKKKLFHM